MLLCRLSTLLLTAVSLFGKLWAFQSLQIPRTLSSTSSGKSHLFSVQTYQIDATEVSPESAPRRPCRSHSPVQNEDRVGRNALQGVRRKRSTDQAILLAISCPDDALAMLSKRVERTTAWIWEVGAICVHQNNNQTIYSRSKIYSLFMMDCDCSMPFSSNRLSGCHETWNSMMRLVKLRVCCLPATAENELLDMHSASHPGSLVKVTGWLVPVSIFLTICHLEGTWLLLQCFSQALRNPFV